MFLFSFFFLVLLYLYCFISYEITIVLNTLLNITEYSLDMMNIYRKEKSGILVSLKREEQFFHNSQLYYIRIYF